MLTVGNSCKAESYFVGSGRRWMPRQRPYKEVRAARHAGRLQVGVDAAAGSRSDGKSGVLQRDGGLGVDLGQLEGAQSRFDPARVAETILVRAEERAYGGDVRKDERAQVKLRPGVFRTEVVGLALGRLEHGSVRLGDERVVANAAEGGAVGRRREKRLCRETGEDANGCGVGSDVETSRRSRSERGGVEGPLADPPVDDVEKVVFRRVLVTVAGPDFARLEIFEQSTLAYDARVDSGDPFLLPLLHDAAVPLARLALFGRERVDPQRVRRCARRSDRSCA